MDVAKLRKMVPQTHERVNWARYKELFGVNSIYEKRGGQEIEIAREIGSHRVDVKDPLSRRMLREVQRAVRNEPRFAQFIEKYGLEFVTFSALTELTIETRGITLEKLAPLKVPEMLSKISDPIIENLSHGVCIDDACLAMKITEEPTTAELMAFARSYQAATGRKPDHALKKYLHKKN